MKTDRYAKNGIGWMEEKKMCASVDLVNTYMGVPAKVECKAVYTNEFLTKIDLPKCVDEWPAWPISSGWTGWG